MAKNKFYAVARGRKPGIYTEWFGEKGAEIQVRGFVGARYHGFVTLAEAKTWLEQANSGRSASMPRPAQAQTPLASATPRLIDSPEPAIEIEVYTDGACRGNPGPGGYAAVILAGGQRLELSGGYRRTTNNRMELTACIVALQAVAGKPGKVLIHTDSQYVYQSIVKKWAQRWRARGWLRSNGQPAENSDLWSRLLELCDQHQVQFDWLRGHAGHLENERSDRLAVAAAARSDLPADPGYH